ncbi:MAG: hypothetical protein ACYCVD_11165 [Desulfitobacteriaceae bacterium]
MAALLPPALVAAVEPEPEKALVQARRTLRAGELLLVTGSCYLVGPLRSDAGTQSIEGLTHFPLHIPAPSSIKRLRCKMPEKHRALGG